MRAKTICSANGNAAEVVVTRATINRVATAAQKERKGSLAAVHVQIILPSIYNLFFQRKSCKVIVRRAKTNRLATASQERTQGESESYAGANSSTKHIQVLLPTEKLQK